MRTFDLPSLPQVLEARPRSAEVEWTAPREPQAEVHYLQYFKRSGLFFFLISLLLIPILPSTLYTYGFPILE